MIDKKNIYIAVSIFIVLLIVALIVWAVYIGNAGRELTKPADLGTFSGSSGGGSPFGNFFGTDDFGTGDSGPGVSEEPAQVATLSQVYNLPIAGATSVQKTATTGTTTTATTSVRFVDRANGHVFEKEMPNGTTRRILQTTVPRVYEALWVEKGQGVIRRYLNDEEEIRSIYNKLPEEATDSKSIPLADNIQHITAIQNSARIFSLIRTPQGLRGAVSNPDSSDSSTIWSSTLRGWLAEWNTNGEIILFQKPANTLPGSAYALDAVSGSLARVLAQVQGLSVNPSTDGARFLYSTMASGRPQLFVHDRSTGVNTSLGIATFAEKCVWSKKEPASAYCALPDTFKNAAYPDAWYKGEVHFADSIWKVDVENEIITEVLSPERAYSVSLDAVRLFLDEPEEYLFFTNNTDQTLWTIRFPEETE